MHLPRTSRSRGACTVVGTRGRWGSHFRSSTGLAVAHGRAGPWSSWRCGLVVILFVPCAGSQWRYKGQGRSDLSQGSPCQPLLSHEMVNEDGARTGPNEIAPLYEGSSDPRNPLQAVGHLRAIAPRLSSMRISPCSGWTSRPVVGFDKNSPNAKSLPFQRGFCDPAGARTQDPNIKSVVLYQLSYRIFHTSWAVTRFPKGAQK